MSELDAALDLIHDRWFDLDTMTFDRDEGKLVLPFWTKPTTRPPRDRRTGQYRPFDQQLVIFTASSFKVEDREHIGIYSLNRLMYVDGEIVITAEPYVTITVAVGELHLMIRDLAHKT